jgi:hypothetical protein
MSYPEPTGLTRECGHTIAPSARLDLLPRSTRGCQTRLAHSTDRDRESTHLGWGG